MPRGRLGLAWWLVATLALIALVLVVVQTQRTTVMQQQVARLTDEAVKRSIAAKAATEQTGAELRHASEQIALLEGKVRDLAAYREQMRDLVQTVVQARDETLLASLNATLLLAQDQAQLTDNPQPMVVALRAAKRRIAQSADPRLAPVHHAVERDLQRLKEVQVPDTAGLLQRIDDVMHAVDALPLARADEVKAGNKEASDGVSLTTLGAPERSWWGRVRLWLAETICGSWCRRDGAVGLVDAVHDEAALARQSLRLRLLSAKLGLLAQQQESARTDLATALTLLKVGFDADAPQVVALVESLQQVHALVHVPVLPQLDDTLAALTQAAAPPESD